MKLNTSTWQEFKLSELFDMQNGFFNNKPETVATDADLKEILARIREIKHKITQ